MALQIVYFLLAAAVLTVSGGAVLLPALRRGDFSSVTSRLMLSFAVKMLLGAAAFIIAWKVFDWPSTLSAFGASSAYLAALTIIMIAVFRTTKRGDR